MAAQGVGASGASTVSASGTTSVQADSFNRLLEELVEHAYDSPDVETIEVIFRRTVVDERAPLATKLGAQEQDEKVVSDCFDLLMSRAGELIETQLNSLVKIMFETVGEGASPSMHNVFIAKFAMSFMDAKVTMPTSLVHAVMNTRAFFTNPDETIRGGLIRSDASHRFVPHLMQPIGEIAQRYVLWNGTSRSVLSILAEKYPILHKLYSVYALTGIITLSAGVGARRDVAEVKETADAEAKTKLLDEAIDGLRAHIDTLDA